MTDLLIRDMRRWHSIGRQISSQKSFGSIQNVLAHYGAFHRLPTFQRLTVIDKKEILRPVSPQVIEFYPV